MLLRYFYDTKLAQASYLVGCAATGEALVVDPNRDVDQYVRAAEGEGMRITHVTETHIRPGARCAHRRHALSVRRGRRRLDVRLCPAGSGSATQGPRHLHGG
jgi:hypothetical protein